MIFLLIFDFWAGTVWHTSTLRQSQKHTCRQTHTAWKKWLPLLDTHAISHTNANKNKPKHTLTHRNTRKLFTDCKKQAYSCGHCGLPLHYGLPCSSRSEPWGREEGKLFPTHALQQLQKHSKGSFLRLKRLFHIAPHINQVYLSKVGRLLTSILSTCILALCIATICTPEQMHSYLVCIGRQEFFRSSLMDMPSVLL